MTVYEGTLESYTTIKTETDQLAVAIRSKLSSTSSQLFSTIDQFGLGNLSTEMFNNITNTMISSLTSYRLVYSKQYLDINAKLTTIRNKLSLYLSRSQITGPEYKNLLYTDKITLDILTKSISSIGTYHSNVISNIKSAQNGTLGKVSPSDDIKVGTSILYPPINIFPKNLQIPQWIKPRWTTETFSENADTVESRVGKSLSSKLNSLSFDTGVGGKLNIIKVSSPIYLDYLSYNHIQHFWHEQPIVIMIDGKDISTNTDGSKRQADRTNYLRKDPVLFEKNAASLTDDLVFYFDGIKLITNYDFSNPEDRKRISVKYKKIADNIKVKAVLLSNSSGMVYKTPVIDQYTLLVGKQR